MSDLAHGRGERVSTLELFFDLVFVFTITQLTAVLARHPNGRGLAQVAIMLGLIWWMYGGYAWLTNAVAPDSVDRRLLLFGGMAAYLVLALSIPRSFSSSGLAFGLSYLAIVSVHAALFLRTSSASVFRAVLGIAPFNGVSALVVLAGGIVGGTLQYALWAAAVVLEWITPYLIDDSGFEVKPAHFVERHGLVVIIALGESVVAVGIGAAGLHVNLSLVGVALLGLLLSACLWWLYFGGDDERAERALLAASAKRRPRLAVEAFGHWHLALLLGVIAVASALRRSTGHAFASLSFAHALALAGGVALFLAGDVGFRSTLGIAGGRWRTVAAVVALTTIPLGTSGAAAFQIGTLVVLLVAAFAVERYAPKRRRRAAA